MSAMTNWRFVLLAAAIASAITMPASIKAAALIGAVWMLQQIGG